MPLSAGLIIGFLAIIAGIAMFAISKLKRLAMTLACTGAVIALITGVVIALAVHSKM
jgi:hypothetical protein